MRYIVEYNTVRYNDKEVSAGGKGKGERGKGEEVNDPIPIRRGRRVNAAAGNSN